MSVSTGSNCVRRKYSKYLAVHGAPRGSVYNKQHGPLTPGTIRLARERHEESAAAHLMYVRESAQGWGNPGDLDKTCALVEKP